MKEEWKNIDGHPFFAISNYGNVVKLDENGFIKRNLKVQTSSNGYKYVNISYTKHIVAKLVAKHFIPNPDGCKFVKYKDGDTGNIHYTNLYWSSTTSIKDRAIIKRKQKNDKWDGVYDQSRSEWTKSDIRKEIKRLNKLNKVYER